MINLLSSESSRCIQCGSCSSACVVARITRSYNPRRILYDIKLGREPEERAIWLCLRCHTCESRCPNSVKIPDIIGVLREESLEAGRESKAVEVYLDISETIFSEGVTVLPVSGEVKEFKAESGLDLPFLPQEVRAELRKIMRSVGFEDRLKKITGGGLSGRG
ncbi:MAG: hypothetical protein DRJ62_00925 [Thermoprotei archaeon]|nr:MAG: hypothetical protein DRJ62_00925 [Thermoprotei archaeon]